MARMFITGSSDGLGLMAAQLLLEQGHKVLAHARNIQRAQDNRQKLPHAEEGPLATLPALTRPSARCCGGQ